MCLPGDNTKSFAQIIAVLLIIFCSYTARSQQVKFIKVLPPLRNFSGIVGGMTQDKNGYMWIATSGGLYRYDGYRFRLYANDPANPNSIASSRLETVYADRKGMIWIATWAEGLDCLDPATGVFTHFRQSANVPGSLSNDTVRSILEDREGSLWLGTTSGLDRYDPKTKTFQNYRYNPNDPGSLSCNRVRNIYEDREGTLWIATGSVWVNEGGGGDEGGLNRLDRETGKFIRYKHDAKNPRSLLNNKVQALYEDSRGTFWVGTAGDGLHTLDRRTGNFSRHPYDPAHPENPSRPPLKGTSSYDHVTSITEDGIGNIWIGTLENGISRYNPKTGQTTFFGKKDSAIGFTDDSGWRFYNSRDGILWIGTWQGGLFRIDPFHKDISHITVGSNVGAFLEEPDSHYWIGSGEGLIRRNTKTGASETFVHDPVNTTTLTNNSIRSLFRDKEGTVWVGTSNGFNRFNPGNNTFTRYVNRAGDPTSIGIGEIYSIEEAGGDSLWVGTDNGLDRMSKRTGACTHFRNNPKDSNSLTRNDIGPMVQDEAGNLWVGTFPGGGLNYMPRNSGAFKHFFKGISILSLCRDASGSIWVGTDGAGVYHGNAGGDDFTKISAPGSGLGTAPVLSIQEDNQKNIWLRTETDIYRLNPQTGQTTIFGSHYGVNTGNLNYNAGYKGRTGEIYFGDVNGYYVFLPGDFFTNAMPPKVVLTDLRIGGKSVVPGKGHPIDKVIEQATEINLQDNQNAFVIDFAAIHYGSPEHNRHLYKLENYDPDWREAGAEKSASYYNVPPGKYHFKVRAASGEGVWAEKSIAIVIYPPWWLTWWAYTIYILVAAIAIRAYFKFYVNRAKLKAQLSFEKLEAKRIKELDAVKTQLYTNITHEFRTPLTIILGMAQQVLAKPAEHFATNMNMIIRNGKSLLKLVNEMLDLSKLETGKMHLQFVNGDVINFLRYVTESFQSLAESQQKGLHFLTDIEAMFVVYDAEKLQQIVANLLSNALKFTPEKGNIYITIGKNDLPGNETHLALIIKVKDTGFGIPDDQLQNIFDRFYQLDNSHTRVAEGTGIGLSLTRELIKLMQGDISVKSPPAGANKGSEFTVTLPLLKASPLQEPVTYPLPIDEVYSPTDKSTQGNSLPAQQNLTSEKPLLLLVEDNADVVAYTASCLPDYRLAVGKDGREGFDIAKEIIPDLIITDVMMPFVDGFELVSRLRGDELTSHIPIIMLTAKADMESKMEGLQKGVDAYLEKPFHKEELLLRIKKLLELRISLQNHYLRKAGVMPTTVTVDLSLSDGTAINKVEDAFVTKVRESIEHNLTGAGFTIEQLCKTVFMSHSQLHRKLEALTGCSPNKFIRIIRLKQAKILLKNLDNSISSVAFDCGYNDPAYFTRVFKQEFGLTPQEWRVKEKASTV